MLAAPIAEMLESIEELSDVCSLSVCPIFSNVNVVMINYQCSDAASVSFDPSVRGTINLF